MLSFHASNPPSFFPSNILSFLPSVVDHFDVKGHTQNRTRQNKTRASAMLNCTCLAALCTHSHCTWTENHGDRFIKLICFGARPRLSPCFLSLSLPFSSSLGVCELTVPSQQAVFLLPVLWRAAERLQWFVCLSLSLPPVEPPRAGSAVS